ncbi:nucleotide exchange factor GrpE [Mycobacterium sp. NAZ190054]|uniref:nucleotide exchange factor GrpE n=1 Tax=Mycobacterium sp. NAZ190054 TaxID=1747766 RepID=UPI0007950A7E|nr:nucleotide exchange factor GrpE [Mycobacterium sp. NAZ190054]KWX68250.1 molecular chaperone GrpE [Mycobacterium sp. NAZ190054]
MSANDQDRVKEEEPITVTDKRRIDPETGQVRETPAAAPSGPAPEDAAAEPTVESVEADKAAELLADLQRVQADFANYRKRSLRDQQVIADRAKATVISQLLPIIDDLDRARSHGDLESGPLKAVADKLISTLEGLGLTGFGAEGDEFDPALHEAVQHEGEGTHPVVGTVMRRGYKIGEQVVRHAMVGVVDTVPDASDTDNADAEPPQPSES